MERLPAMENIMQKYRKTIWNRFTKGVREFAMINSGDNIAVCISGGKDSMILAKCMEKYQQISGVSFSLTFLCMNPGYTEENMNRILMNAEKLRLPLEVFNTRIFSSLEKAEKNPCFLCARLRRGALYKAAQDRGCNKIALGHHFDDVIETILMGMLYGGQVQTMMPKLHSENYKGVEVIRPLYYVREASVIEWAEENSLEFLRCACTVTGEKSAEQQETSKRQEIKELIRSLKNVNPDIESHIFRSVWNVDLRHIISYHIGDDYHHFMNDYDSMT